MPPHIQHYNIRGTFTVQLCEQKKDCEHVDDLDLQSSKSREEGFKGGTKEKQPAALDSTTKRGEIGQWTERHESETGLEQKRRRLQRRHKRETASSTCDGTTKRGEIGQWTERHESETCRARRAAQTVQYIKGTA